MKNVALERKQQDVTIDWVNNAELREVARGVFLQVLQDTGDVGAYWACIEMCTRLVHNKHPADLEQAKRVLYAEALDWYRNFYPLAQEAIKDMEAAISKYTIGADTSVSAMFTVSVPEDGDHVAHAEKLLGKVRRDH